MLDLTNFPSSTNSGIFRPPRAGLFSHCLACLAAVGAPVTCISRGRRLTKKKGQAVKKPTLPGTARLSRCFALDRAYYLLLSWVGGRRQARITVLTNVLQGYVRTYPPLAPPLSMTPPHRHASSLCKDSTCQRTPQPQGTHWHTGTIMTEWHRQIGACPAQKTQIPADGQWPFQTCPTWVADEDLGETLIESSTTTSNGERPLDKTYYVLATSHACYVDNLL